VNDDVTRTFQLEAFPGQALDFPGIALQQFDPAAQFLVLTGQSRTLGLKLSELLPIGPELQVAVAAENEEGGESRQREKSETRPQVMLRPVAHPHSVS